jgi:hypothetical protein
MNLERSISQQIFDPNPQPPPNLPDYQGFNPPPRQPQPSVLAPQFANNSTDSSTQPFPVNLSQNFELVLHSNNPLPASLYRSELLENGSKDSNHGDGDNGYGDIDDFSSGSEKTTNVPKYQRGKNDAKNYPTNAAQFEPKPVIVPFQSSLTFTSSPIKHQLSYRPYINTSTQTTRSSLLQHRSIPKNPVQIKTNIVDNFDGTETIQQTVSQIRKKRSNAHLGYQNSPKRQHLISDDNTSGLPLTPVKLGDKSLQSGNSTQGETEDDDQDDIFAFIPRGERPRTHHSSGLRANNVRNPANTDVSKPPSKSNKKVSKSLNDGQNKDDNGDNDDNFDLKFDPLYIQQLQQHGVLEFEKLISKSLKQTPTSSSLSLSSLNQHMLSGLGAATYGTHEGNSGTNNSVVLPLVNVQEQTELLIKMIHQRKKKIEEEIEKQRILEQETLLDAEFISLRDAHQIEMQKRNEKFLNNAETKLVQFLHNSQNIRPKSDNKNTNSRIDFLIDQNFRHYRQDCLNISSQDRHKRNSSAQITQTCHCKSKTQCLSLHCGCFKYGGFCSPSCKCSNCLNNTLTESNLIKRSMKILQIKKKYPLAFSSAVITVQQPITPLDDNDSSKSDLSSGIPRPNDKLNHLTKSEKKRLLQKKRRGVLDFDICGINNNNNNDGGDAANDDDDDDDDDDDAADDELSEDEIFLFDKNRKRNNAKTNNQTEETPINTNKPLKVNIVGCNCKTSQCLSVQCGCFKFGGVCGPHCRCINCFNDKIEQTTKCTDPLHPNLTKQPSVTTSKGKSSKRNNLYHQQLGHQLVNTISQLAAQKNQITKMQLFELEKRFFQDDHIVILGIPAEDQINTSVLDKLRDDDDYLITNDSHPVYDSLLQDGYHNHPHHLSKHNQNTQNFEKSPVKINFDDPNSLNLVFDHFDHPTDKTNPSTLTSTTTNLAPHKNNITTPTAQPSNSLPDFNTFSDRFQPTYGDSSSTTNSNTSGTSTPYQSPFTHSRSRLRHDFQLNDLTNGRFQPLSLQGNNHPAPLSVNQHFWDNSSGLSSGQSSGLNSTAPTSQSVLPTEIDFVKAAASWFKPSNTGGINQFGQIDFDVLRNSKLQNITYPPHLTPSSTDGSLTSNSNSNYFGKLTPLSSTQSETSLYNQTSLENQSDQNQPKDGVTNRAQVSGSFYDNFNQNSSSRIGGMNGMLHFYTASSTIAPLSEPPGFISTKLFGATLDGLDNDQNGEDNNNNNNNNNNMKSLNIRQRPRRQFLKRIESQSDSTSGLSSGFGVDRSDRSDGDWAALTRANTLWNSFSKFENGTTKETGKHKNQQQSSAMQKGYQSVAYESDKTIFKKNYNKRTSFVDNDKVHIISNITHARNKQLNGSNRDYHSLLDNKTQPQPLSQLPPKPREEEEVFFVPIVKRKPKPSQQ